MYKIRMRRTLTAIGTTAAAVGLAFSGLMTGTAQAAYTDCPQNNICVWQHSDYNGDRYTLRNGYRTTFNSTWNDRASSVYSNTNQQYCLYADASYRGRAVVVSAGARTRDLANIGFNDATSSIKYC